MDPFETWVRLLNNPPFKFGFFTFLATCLSLLIKFSSRPVGLTREDFAFGLDLAQVSIFAILADGAAKVVSAFAAGETQFGRPVVAKLIFLQELIFWMVAVLFFAALLVKSCGWKKERTTIRKSTHRLAGDTHVNRVETHHPAELNWFGVLFPLPLGILYTVIVVLWMFGE